MGTKIFVGTKFVGTKTQKCAKIAKYGQKNPVNPVNPVFFLLLSARKKIIYLNDFMKKNRINRINRIST